MYLPMLPLNILDITLPLTDPILKFFVILTIILLAPLLLNKISIPPILGLIIAGAVIGPYGINLMERDSSIILSGTAGLLYIMFLAGLEIDLGDFRRNSSKSLLFGMYTFLIPMVLGIVAGLYGLNFSTESSVLLASMFASHTLIAYPIISKYGITKNRAVTVAVGGTIITDTLSLLVLAIIVGMATGEVDPHFWAQLGVSILLFGCIVIFLFPVITRWFFKRVKESVSQYIFVLALVFLGAVLAELAGIEGIIGAFLTGLSLNKLIPSTSSLMNRIEFVGNAIFIPFFLISVGMLVDYRAFFRDFETIKVAAVMTGVAILAKYLAALFTQKSFKYSADERRVIFGLSNAQAAATLAAVTVGYNVIIGETAAGEPIRLLNDSVLNGTIVMILVTCTIASFAAQRGARNISLSESISDNKKEGRFRENILIPLKDSENTDELINLSVLIKRKDNRTGVYALNVINNQESDPSADGKSHKILEKAQQTAASADIQLNTLLRYDVNVPNAIMSVIKENKVTDLVLGLHEKKEFSESFLGHTTERILGSSNVTTYIYRPVQPVATVKRNLVVIPENAEEERIPVMGHQDVEPCAEHGQQAALLRDEKDARHPARRTQGQSHRSRVPPFRRLGRLSHHHEGYAARRRTHHRDEPQGASFVSDRHEKDTQLHGEILLGLQFHSHIPDTYHRGREREQRPAQRIAVTELQQIRRYRQEHLQSAQSQMTAGTAAVRTNEHSRKRIQESRNGPHTSLPTSYRCIARYVLGTTPSCLLKNCEKKDGFGKLSSSEI